MTSCSARKVTQSPGFAPAAVEVREYCEMLLRQTLLANVTKSPLEAAPSCSRSRLEHQ